MIIFDLETIGTHPTSYVLSIAAVAITMHDKDASYEEIHGRAKTFVFDLDEQSLVGGFTLTDSTVKWWLDQGPMARSAVIDNATSPTSVILHRLRSLGESDQEDGTWWCRGPHFDAAILHNLCHRFSHPTPFKYNAVRDLRTFFEDRRYKRDEPMDPRQDPEENGFEAHDPAHDVAAEAMHFINCLKRTS